VQGAIEEAIGKVSGETVVIEAAGRTDTGVHASGQAVTFRSSARLDPATWGRALNAHLPADVAVRATAAVDEGFHARYSAQDRSYRYRVLCATAPSPLRERYALRVARALDADAMGRAAAVLLGEHDFAAFGSSPRGTSAEGARGHTVRVMYAAGCRRLELEDAEVVGGVVSGAAHDGEGTIAFDFTANAFLTGMVRRLVGTLLLVGDGRLSSEDFAAILAARTKTHLGAAVAARGLCLVGVRYPTGAVQWERVR
jgi:tRNA pseudouridine38-40 synthase